MRRKAKVMHGSYNISILLINRQTNFYYFLNAVKIFYGCRFGEKIIIGARGSKLIEVSTAIQRRRERWNIIMFKLNKLFLTDVNGERVLYVI